MYLHSQSFTCIHGHSYDTGTLLYMCGTQCLSLTHRYADVMFLLDIASLPRHQDIPWATSQPRPGAWRQKQCPKHSMGPSWHTWNVDRITSSKRGISTFTHGEIDIMIEFEYDWVLHMISIGINWYHLSIYIYIPEPSFGTQKCVPLSFCSFCKKMLVWGSSNKMCSNYPG